MRWPWQHRSGEAKRSRASRHEAEREVIGPLRAIRHRIESAPAEEDPSSDVLAEAIRTIIRGRK